MKIIIITFLLMVIYSLIYNTILNEHPYSLIVGLFLLSICFAILTPFVVHSILMGILFYIIIFISTIGMICSIKYMPYLFSSSN